MSASQLNLTVPLVDFTCSSIVKTTIKWTELDRINFTWLLEFTVHMLLNNACTRNYLQMINFFHQAVDKYNETNAGK